MLNENYTYYNHTDFEAASQDEYACFKDGDKAEYAKLEIAFEQYQTLKTRVIDLIASGYTLTRLAIDTQPPRVNYRSVGDGQWPNTLQKWLESFKNCRTPSHYSDQPTLAEVVEAALKQLFDTLDTECQSKDLAPIFVMTSVSKAIMEGFSSARQSNELVEINTPAGSGKTFTTNQYIALCRKEEGFNCPLWRITLCESNNSLKHVLFEIVQAMRGQTVQGFNTSSGFNNADNDYTLSAEIERMAAMQRGGLLIIDEAQNLFNKLKGATTHHGLGIINELRTFTDNRLMGIALLSNGEVYKKAEQANATQITRRMEAWRVDAGKPTSDDVELVMQAWQVSGKDAREWSIKVGMGKGGLGALTAFYRAARQKYGEINYTILSSFRNG